MEEEKLWTAITQKDPGAWWTVDKDDCNQYILYIGDKTVDEFLGEVEKTVVTSFDRPILDEFKFSHVKVQFEKATRKPALLPVAHFRPMSSSVGRLHLESCITADQFVEAWTKMIYNFASDEDKESENEDALRSEEEEDSDGSISNDNHSNQEEESNDSHSNQEEESNDSHSNQEEESNDSHSNQEEESNDSHSNQEEESNDSHSNQEEQSNNGRSNQEEESNNGRSNQEEQSNNGRSNQEEESNNGRSNHEEQSNNGRSNQEQSNNGRSNQEEQSNNGRSNQKEQSNNGRSNQEEQSNNGHSNQEEQSNNGRSNQEEESNNGRSNQEEQSNNGPSNKEQQSNVGHVNQDETLLEAVGCCVGTFKLSIEQLEHPEKSRQVRALNERHVENLKKSFLTAGSLTFQSAGSLVGLIKREDCPTVKDFEKGKLQTYRVEILDGNHRLEAQRRALMETKNVEKRQMFSKREVTLYAGLPDDICLATGILHNNTGAQHMSMSDMDMTQLFRNILLSFLKTTEEELKEDSVLEGTTDYFSHIRDKILRLPADDKHALKAKFDTYRIRLKLAQLSPRCYKLAMMFFTAEKIRGKDMKASTFKWLQGTSEEEIYRLLCKATANSPVTRQHLKEAAEEATGNKSAKLMDKCKMTLKAGLIECKEGGRTVKYKHIEVTAGRKITTLTAEELKACLSGKASTTAKGSRPGAIGPSASRAKTSRSATTGPSVSRAKTSRSGKTGPSTSPAKTSRSGKTGPSTSPAKTSRSGKTGPSTSRAKTSRSGTTGPSTSPAKTSRSGTTGPSTSPAKTSRSGTTGPSTSPAKRSRSGTTAEGTTPAKQKKKRKLSRDDQYQAAKAAIERSAPSINKSDPFYEDVRLESTLSMKVGDIVIVDPGQKQHKANDPWVVVVMDVKRGNIEVKFLNGGYGLPWDVSGYAPTTCDLKKVAAKVWFPILPLGTQKMPKDIEEKVKELHEVSLNPNV
ncbi:uncharacterized protein LOC144874298 isoform X1 [Branchiostoma floridae x Branchiostoma japonicum]